MLAAGGLDNPTYDGQTTTATIRSSAEVNFDNPLYNYEGHVTQPTNQREDETDSNDHVYSDVKESTSSQPTQRSVIYEALYSNDTIPAQGGDITAPLGKGRGQVNEPDGTQNGDVITEHTYELPQMAQAETADDDGCYSQLQGQTYAQLQPHIAKPMQPPLPPNDGEDEYSCLQHK